MPGNRNKCNVTRYNTINDRQVCDGWRVSRQTYVASKSDVCGAAKICTGATAAYVVMDMNDEVTAVKNFCAIDRIAILPRKCELFFQKSGRYGKIGI